MVDLLMIDHLTCFPPTGVFFYVLYCMSCPKLRGVTDCRLDQDPNLSRLAALVLGGMCAPPRSTDTFTVV